MTLKTPKHDPFLLHRLLSDLDESNSAQIVALTTIIEHIDSRISRIEDLLTPPARSN